MWAISRLLARGALWLFFKRVPRERRNLIVGNVLVFLGLAWTLVTLGEAYFRYVYDATDSYGLTVTNWAWFRRHCSDLNSDGFREVPLGANGKLHAKPAGTRRVAFLGDSFTFGYGVPDRRDLFPQRLGTTAEFAELAFFLVTHSYMNGETVRMDGGIRMTPR